MRILSLFDGMSCGQIAFRELGIPIDEYYAYEIDKYAIQVTQHNFPNTIQCGDVFKADFTKYEGIDWVVGGSPCFAAGTMVKTKDGFKEIQNIVVGDKVLTHTGNYKKVTKVMTKIADKYCVLSGENTEDIVCTPNHRFYTKQMSRIWDNETKSNKRILSDGFSWTPVEDFVCERNDSQTIKSQTYISCITDDIKQIPDYSGCEIKTNQFNTKHTLSLNVNDSNFWYVVGRYIGDGWLKYKYKTNGKKLSGVIICCGKHEINELESKVKLSGFNYSITEEKTTYRVTITNVELANFLLQFGVGAKNKHLNANIFNLLNEQLDSFIKGYLDADGHYGDNTITATTISKELAYGIKYIINKLYKKPCCIKKTSSNDLILGRKVNVHDIYTLNFPTNDNKQKHYFVEDNLILTPYKKIETISEPLQVFNLSVEDDESYTANGIVVHNCTYWSIAQKNNRETEASGIGWELFNQYIRAIKEAKPKYFLYENNKSMSQAIRKSINEAFGFEAIGINSALVSAQNRQRLYWVGIRQENGSYKKANIEQPEDKKILLKDILESSTIAWNTLEQNQRNMIAESVTYCNDKNMETLMRPYGSKAKIVGEEDNKSSTLMAAMGTGGGNGIYKAESIRIGALPRPNGELSTSQAMRIYSVEGKAVAQSAQSGGLGGKTGLYACPMIVPEATKRGYVEINEGECVDLSMEKSKTRRGRKMADKSNCLTKTNEFYQYCGTIDLYAIPNKNPEQYLSENMIDYAYKPGTKNFVCKEKVMPDKSCPLTKEHNKRAGTTNYIPTNINNIECTITTNKEIPNAKPIYEVKDGFITIRNKQYPIKLKDGYYIIRKLSVLECARLQTIPEWYDFSYISNSQAYKCLGNGWTVEVIKYLIQSALSNGAAMDYYQDNLFNLYLNSINV